MFETTLLFNNLRRLSSTRIYAQVLQYSELANKYNSTFSKYPWQLFILPIETKTDLSSFGDFTKSHLISNHVWFVIFWGDFLNFCNHPKSSVLRLGFDTRMLVKCYDDPFLHEWYSVNGKDKIMTNNLMTWTPKNGLVLKNFKNLYERRTDVAGTNLRVSSVRVRLHFLLFLLNFRLDLFGCTSTLEFRYSGLHTNNCAPRVSGPLIQLQSPQIMDRGLSSLIFVIIDSRFALRWFNRKIAHIYYTSSIANVSLRITSSKYSFNNISHT